jgi:hypothetical protein
METVRNTPWVCRVVLYRKAAKGRVSRTKPGTVARRKNSLQAAARERWLIVAAPALSALGNSSRCMAGVCRSSCPFRDLKSHRYGQGFEYSLTRSGKHLDALLLVHAMAKVAAWLAGLACGATGLDRWLYPARATQKLGSIMCVGREAMTRLWPMERISGWIERLRSLPPAVLDQMRVAT